MGTVTTTDVVSTLERAEREICDLLVNAEREIDAASREFEGLARETDAVLSLAAGVIGCVEDESIQSILPQVHAVGREAKQFIHKRLDTTAGILEEVRNETKLLDGLRALTREQRSVAREIQSLSVLTNIEVARLNQMGAGFKHLAQRLDDFSLTVAKGTKELANHTDERRRAIEETRRRMGIEVPRMRRELASMEADLGRALEAFAAGLASLSEAPSHFRCCVEAITLQVAGVVAAIQAHDITRQQLEHVRDALKLIAVRTQSGEASERAKLTAGLAIQIYQLKSIRGTMGGWVAQIRTCMEEILCVGVAELLDIGPLVLSQERGLSQELARIEMLVEECQRDSAAVRETLQGQSRLMQLVSEHVERSRSVHERLQLLTFNSIIEASRLGTDADAILEISRSIKRIGSAWGGMTERSAQAMQQIEALVEQGKTQMDAYSQESNHISTEAEAETRAGLERLRAAASFAARQGAAIAEAVARLKAQIAVVGAIADRLGGSASQIDVVMAEVEEVKGDFESGEAKWADLCEPSEVEAIFGASYTTEMEREVLRAALAGDPLPEARQNLAGNDVELF